MSGAKVLVVLSLLLGDASEKESDCMVASFPVVVEGIEKRIKE